MSIDNLIDKLGQAPSNSMTMKQAVEILKENAVFNSLVIAVNSMPKEEITEIFHAISIIKAGIMKNAFTEGDGEDMRAFENWTPLIAFIDTLMEGLSNT